MKHSIEKMEMLVRTSIQPEQAKKLLIPSTGNEILQQWTTVATEESEKMRLYLLHKNLHTHDKNVMRQLAAQYLAEIIYLLDLLFAYKKLYLPPLLADLYDFIIKRLEALILLLQLRYPDYFNEFQRVPSIELHRYRTLLRGRVRILKQNISPLIADKKLLPILMIPLCQFAGYSEGLNPTYTELWYMQNLVKKLTTLITHHNGNPIDSPLIEFLLLYNFNSAAFIDYFTKELSGKAELLTNNFQKSTYWALQLKLLLQLKIIPGSTLVTGMPSAKQELLNWIREEIIFLAYEPGQKEIIPCPQVQLSSKKGIETDIQEKIKTSFSVAEMALLLRSLQETEMIQCHDRRGLMKKISNSFSSVGTEKNGISWPSMDSKYSAVEQDTIHSLKRKVRKINTYLSELEQKLK